MTDNKKDYKDTVFLPQSSFPMQGGLPKKEPELLDYWQKIDLHGQLRATAPGRKKFILHDGPPYANGNIHIGTALTKILKDTLNRSYQMLGFDAPYVPGWDCHGLPIEWKIEEQYRAKGLNKDEVPVLQFRAECRAFAEYWKNVQSKEFQRLGAVGDWAHPYSTMTKKAEAQILREMYKFVENGLLYKGVKPVMWSVVEKTALAEAEIEYADHTSTTLWVKFPIVKTAKKELEGASIVIWTTTPWTIPANRAIAYGDFEYVLIRPKSVAREGPVIGPALGALLIVAKDRLNDFAEMAQIVAYDTLATLSKADLEESIIAHPFRNRAGSEGYFDYEVPLLFGDFVTTDAGTGFVHIAPAHGEDDYHLINSYNIAKFNYVRGPVIGFSGQELHERTIPIESVVEGDGRYISSLKGFAGLYVYKPDGKVGEANGAIIKALLEANALLAKKNIKHSYPHSWRSKAPLIFRTTPQWFIAMDSKIAATGKTLRETAMQAIGDTNWYPEIGQNRIGGMVESRPDWCISRQRAWGVPIALFVHKISGEVLKDREVLNRVASLFEQDGADAWYARPAQEFLGDKYRAEDYHQVFDVADVWFESGSTHAFCIDQRNGVSEWPNLSWPADLYCEGSDQHRGWFQSSLLEGCGTLGRAPFNNVVTNGFVLDEQGRKMSKSLGNVTAPQEVYDKMGADILRLWVASSDYSQDLRIGPDILKQTGDLYRRFRNTLRYLLGALNGMQDAERLSVAEMPELERWVLHRLHETDILMRHQLEKFELGPLLTALHDFCNSDLSAFYFDIRKDSLYCDRPDAARRRATRTVMEQIFNHLVVWLAPILCFTAEEAWLTRHGEGSSVHLQTFPEIPAAWRDEALAKKWAEIRSIRRVVTGALERARNDKKIGAPMEAHPELYLSHSQKNLMQGIDMAEISITSSITLTVADPPADAFVLPDMAGIGVAVGLAQGRKCERCRQVLTEVGGHPDHPDLCNRCHDAVTNGQKQAA